jgi:hypothetical protein
LNLFSPVAVVLGSTSLYDIVVGSRVRGRSRDARPGVSSKLPESVLSPSLISYYLICCALRVY